MNNQSGPIKIKMLVKRKINLNYTKVFRNCTDNFFFIEWNF